MMNSFLLLFVSLWLGQPTTCFRLFMAAGAGSAYCCGWTLITAEVVDVPAFGLSGLGVFLQNIASMIISYVLMCMLMIFLAFGIHNKYLLMKNVAVLYGAALFTAGVFLFLENLQISNSPILIEKQPASGIGGMARSWGLLVLSAAASFLCGLALIRHKNMWKGISDHLYDLCLEFGDKKVHVRALLDTGNRLYEPKARRPVTIVEKTVFEDQYGRDFTKEKAGTFLYVPFHSVGCERGTLQAVIVDVMTIRGNGRQWQYKNAVIGIYPGHFQKSGQYRAILHRDVIASAVPLSSGKRKKKGRRI
ncbi:stage II sporulation protein GA (sporulation sigma-E factor processing peptidase) [Catenibacillus scindens]|uniref:Stage II sporulation protein GA (Sporulation sigma-E factor processing peptidase) n=2 Tax=Catenibacillus scindens TaxID=673271 RepID=A0A7W8H9L6_9FIRM|nr:stage II sporulation protein GA (sporulation sigma-E factor processing peptidase) [Catenibacillus scindens]